MVKVSKGNLIGGWAFLIGVVLAVVLSFFTQIADEWMALLFLIGLIIGLLNVADEESHSFLMSGAVLIIASYLGEDAIGSIRIVSSILTNLLVIFVPATIVVAIRNVFSLARR